jgi:hypothetical protein
MDLRQLMNKATGLAREHSDKLGPLSGFFGGEERATKKRPRRDRRHGPAVNPKRRTKKEEGTSSP